MKEDTNRRLEQEGLIFHAVLLEHGKKRMDVLG